MTTQPSADAYQEQASSPEKPPKLNLPPKPVLASSLATSMSPPSLPVTSLEKSEAVSETEKTSCTGHHRSFVILAILIMLAALLALGMQLWTFLGK